MNLTSVVDQNLSYPQAVGATGDEVKREAPLGSGAEHTQAAEVEAPAPDVEYHEVKLDGTLRPSGDGGVFFRSLSPWEFCEQVKLDARSRAAELLATDMEGMRDALKAKLEHNNPELARKAFTFSIDEAGLIKPVGLGFELAQQEESVLYSLMNEDKALSGAAREYIFILAGIVHRTLEGLDAKYARFFSPAVCKPGSTD
ncbi:hypothetical protein OKW98_23020 [Pseudomonas sp. KU26590]|uniref:hypothetical protein n=1 Tax=Pseudomonas sp. KU26590 TaxID=2991051 RepID=UPI00223DB09C|nr:hypothetical protein [Pseudomonas sp. KU26590]UZJ59390.1 hypothetical protein OKW98_23020 [Pseudomonas sp. KU26590]